MQKQSFKDWYANSFVGKQNIVVQIAAWFFYGFLWIPAWYGIQQVSRTAGKKSESESAQSGEVGTEKEKKPSKMAINIAVLIGLVLLSLILVPVLNKTRFENIAVPEGCEKITAEEFFALEKAFKATVLKDAQDFQKRGGLLAAPAPGESEKNRRDREALARAEARKEVTCITKAVGRNASGQYEIHVVWKYGDGDYSRAEGYLFEKTGDTFRPIRVTLSTGEIMYERVRQQRASTPEPEQSSRSPQPLDGFKSRMSATRFKDPEPGLGGMVYADAHGSLLLIYSSGTGFEIQPLQDASIIAFKTARGYSTTGDITNGDRALYLAEILQYLDSECRENCHAIYKQLDAGYASMQAGSATVTLFDCWRVILSGTSYVNVQKID